MFTEMVSADGLVRKSERTSRYLIFDDDERPIGVQLFGSDPEVIGNAVSILEPRKPDFIDINCGCPVRKVVTRGAGAALLKDLRQLTRICEAAVKTTSIPITAKIRSGWDDENTASELAKTLADVGVCAITIHARTKRAGFSGTANWAVIEKVKKAVSIPVIGNGDIFSSEDAEKMLKETGCDLIMVGRGALGNPFIFEQINYYLENNKKLEPPTIKERIDVCLDHLLLAVQHKPEWLSLTQMRKHIGWYLRSAPHARQLRHELFSYKTLDQIRDRLQLYVQELDCSQDNCNSEHKLI